MDGRRIGLGHVVATMKMFSEDTQYSHPIRDMNLKGTSRKERTGMNCWPLDLMR